MALLEARGLVKQFGGRTVVNGVSVEVRAGEVVGLLGPNGAGKTTSFRMMVGMTTPTNGRVFFAGQDVTDRPMFERARLGLGYLAQEHSIFRKLTVEQNLYAILELITTRQGKPFHPNARQRRKRVEELLEQFGLTKIRRNIAMLCSGGEKRRLEIARCLASDPLLIMLDEPFTGIDPVTTDEIQKIIRSLRDTGISILITDHKAVETLRITDRSYLVAAGQVLVHGTQEEVINHPEARKVYFGEGIQAGASPFENSESATVSMNRLGDRRSTEALRSLLAMDELNEWITQLGGTEAAAAAGKILTRGDDAISPLVQALNRSDANIRSRSHRLLCELTNTELPFDPFADERTRIEQVDCIREYLWQDRKAG